MSQASRFSLAFTKFPGCCSAKYSTGKEGGILGKARNNHGTVAPRIPLISKIGPERTLGVRRASPAGPGVPPLLYFLTPHTLSGSPTVLLMEGCDGRSISVDNRISDLTDGQWPSL